MIVSRNLRVEPWTDWCIDLPINLSSLFLVIVMNKKKFVQLNQNLYRNTRSQDKHLVAGDKKKKKRKSKSYRTVSYQMIQLGGYFGRFWLKQFTYSMAIKKRRWVKSRRLRHRIVIERPSNSTLNKSFDLNIEDSIELFIDNINIEVNENVAEIVRRSSLKQYRTSFFFHFIFYRGDRSGSDRSCSSMVTKE